jgi:hypothetical protein
MSNIVNKSKYIVRVKRRPELTREFPPYKAAEAKAYRDELVNKPPSRPRSSADP